MIPTPFEFVLLALGTFRLVRLVGWDSITEGFRARVTGYYDEEAPELSTVLVKASRRQRAEAYLSTLIRCPWCQGFYVSAAVWGLWVGLGDPVVVGCVPFAVSAVVGLVAKNLDP